MTLLPELESQTTTEDSPEATEKGSKAIKENKGGKYAKPFITDLKEEIPKDTLDPRIVKKDGRVFVKSQIKD